MRDEFICLFIATAKEVLFSSLFFLQEYTKTSEQETWTEDRSEPRLDRIKLRIWIQWRVQELFLTFFNIARQGFLQHNLMRIQIEIWI